MTAVALHREFSEGRIEFSPILSPDCVPKLVRHLRNRAGVCLEIIREQGPRVL